MNNYLKKNWFNATTWLAIMACACVAVFLGYVNFWPPYKAYVPLRPEKHYARYDANGTIRIHREFCSYLDAPVTITREMIKVGQPWDPELRIGLPATIQPYKQGCQEIERIFEIPRGTPTGNYRLVFTAVWDANPFRTDSVSLPEITVAVGGD